jgi:hypothetical protein
VIFVNEDTKASAIVLKNKLEAIADPLAEELLKGDLGGGNSAGSRGSGK